MVISLERDHRHSQVGPDLRRHIAIDSILLVGFIVWHSSLILLKGISLPFWLRAETATRPPFKKN